MDLFIRIPGNGILDNIGLAIGLGDLCIVGWLTEKRRPPDLGKIDLAVGIDFPSGVHLPGIPELSGDRPAASLIHFLVASGSLANFSLHFSLILPFGELIHIKVAFIHRRTSDHARLERDGYDLSIRIYALECRQRPIHAKCHKAVDSCWISEPATRVPEASITKMITADIVKLHLLPLV